MPANLPTRAKDSLRRGEGLPKGKLSFQENKLIPIGEAADFLEVSIDTIRRWDAQGRLHSSRPDGKNRYFSLKELEQIKFSKPLTISEAAVRLGLSPTTLRRLENKGQIRPERNKNGERLYSHQSLEKLAASPYLLRHNHIKERLTAPLEIVTKPTGKHPPKRLMKPDDLAEAVVETREKVLENWEKLLEEREKVIELEEEVFGTKKQLNVVGKGTSWLLRSILSVLLILVITTSWITAFYLISPQGAARFFGDYTYRGFNEQSGIPSDESKTDKEARILGTSTAPVSPIRTNPIGEALRPLSFISLVLVKQLRPETYNQLRPPKYLADVNDVLTVDESGNIVNLYTLRLPRSSYLQVPDTGLITNLNADYLRGKVPGDGTGNLAVFGKDGSIINLKVDETNLKDGSVRGGPGGIIADSTITADDLAPGISLGGGTGDITAVVAGSGLAGGGLSGAVSLAINLTASGTSGLTSSNSGLEVSNAGLTLLKGCADTELLKYTDALGWSCSADSGGGGSLDIEEGNTVMVTSATNLDFLGSDFNVALEGASEANVSIDYASSGITRSGVAETITGGWTFNTLPTTFTTAIDVNTSSTIAGLTIDGAGTLTVNNTANFLGDINANDASADTILLGQNGATPDTVTIAGDVSITDSDWSISVTGVAAGLSGTNTGLTAGDLSCADCIGGTEVDESTLSIPFANVAAGTNTAALVVGTGGSLSVSGTGTITATDLVAGSSVVSDAEVDDNITIDATGSVSATSVNSGTLGNAGVTLALGSFGSITGALGDPNVANNITIDATGSVDWTALTNYPSGCGAGTAVTAVGDTLTCGSFASTLQTAYEGGNSINIDNTQGNLLLNLTDAINDNNIRIDNTTAGDIATALQITTSGVGATIGTAIDVADPDIVVGLALGSNDVTVGGVTISSTEFALLDGKNAALVDTNDAVATAITGVGTLTAGATGTGFTIDFAASTLSGNVTGANISGVDISDDTNLTATNGVTLTGDQLTLSSSTAGAGLTYTTGVLDIGAGDGITVNADSIQVRLDTTAADGTTTSSVSGLEFTGGELSLIRGCANGEVLKWDNTAFTWGCAADNTGGGANSFETIDAPAGTDPVADSATDILQLLVTGTNFTITGDATGDSLTFNIDESVLAGTGLGVSGDTLIVNTGTGLTTSGDNVVVDTAAAFTWTADHTWNLAEAEDLAVNISISGTNSGQGQTITLTNSTTSGNQYGLVVDNAASTGTTEALLVLDNSDTDTAVTAAIQIINAGGGFTNLFDVAGTLISTSEFTILDSGITLGELTDSGTLTATTVDINGGNIDGTTIGATTPAAGTFTGLTVTASALAVNSDSITSDGATLTINAAGTVDIQDNLTADSLTTDTGGVSIAAGQSYTGAGAVTLSSGGAAGLTLDSASNVLTIAGTDTTISRTAAGTFTLDLVDAANTVFFLDNSGAGAANLRVGGLNCTGNANGGALTADASGNISCSDDDGGGGTSWSGLTDPSASLTLNHTATGQFTTTMNWTATGALDPWTMNLTNNAGAATTQRAFSIVNAVTSQTIDVNTEALLRLDNADTALTGSTRVDDALLITASGDITDAITDAIDASDPDILNALNIGANAIAGTNFSVTGAGAVTAVGVNSGTGLIQGTGGLTVTGTVNINTSGANATNIGTGTNTGTITIGNTAGGDLALNDPNWSITGAGLFTTSSNIAVNGGQITSTAATLIINAGGTVDIQDGLTVDSVTTDTGGVSIAAGQSYTGAGAVTLSSGGAAGLTLDSASNTITIAGTDTTISRTAAGTFTLDLVDAANTVFFLDNSGAGAANLRISGLNCTANANGGALTADASGNISCSDDDGGGGTSWSGLTAPSASLTLEHTSAGTGFTTAFNWTDTTNNADFFTFSFDNNGGTAGTDRLFVLKNAVSGATTGDLNTEALLVLDNADTSVSGSTIVDDGLLITVSGGIAAGIVDAIDVSDANITNAINVGANTIVGTTAVIDFTNFDVSSAGALTAVGVDAGTGLLQGTGGLTIIGAVNINTSGANVTNIGTGTNTGTITIGNASGGDLVLSDPNWSVTGAGAATFSSVTSSGAVAANGGITFDAATDTVGAHTAAGTYDMNSNLIINIGAAGTDFTAGGGLTLAGALTANGTATFNADVDLTFAGTENLTVSNTSTSADAVSITASGVTASGVDGLAIAFTQADDADATDTNAALQIDVTSSSLDADTLYAINIGNLTAGAASETALNIGTGWDTGISVGSGGITVSAGGVTIASGALAVNSDTITSDGNLTIDATSTVIIPDADTFQTNDVTSTGALTVTSGTNTNLTLNAAGTGVLVFTGYNCSANANGGALTADASGNISCSDDDGGGGTSWSGLTAPSANLSLAHADFTTSFTFDTASDAVRNYFGLSITNDLATDTTAQRLFTLTNADDAIATGTTDALLYLNNADANEAVAAGIQFANTGGGGFTAGIDMANFTIVNIGAAGTDFSSTGGLTLADNLTVTAGGLTISAGALAVNSDSITSDGATLTINAGGTVDIQDGLTVDSVTTDVGGVSIAAGQSYTGAGAVSLTSGTNSNLTIDAAGTGNIVFTGFTSCTALETNASAQLVCGTDDTGGGSSVWSDLTNPTAALTLNHAEFATTFNWNMATDVAKDGLTLTLTNDLATDTTTQRLLVLRNLDDALGTGTTERLLVLDNADANEAVTTGLEILASSTGTITTAIDVSDAEIGTALSTGANDLSGTNWSITGASGNMTLAGTLAVNGDSITADGATLTINAGGAVDIQDGVTVDSLTTDVGGITILAGQAIVTSAAGGLTIGNASLTALTVTTDGTGDAEVVLPTGSIGAAEILDNSLTFTDLSNTLALDAATTITPGANALTINLDSTGDFVIQDGGVTFFTFANTGTVTIASGGLTITAGALAVNSDSITSDGVLVIDATSAVVLGTLTNGFRVDETFGAGSGWLGTARPTKRIALYAEFPGASLTGDGTGNTGTMTSDNETASPFRNYYNWTSTTAGNDYDVWIKVRLPDDWSAWDGIGTATGFGTAATEDVVVQVYGTNDVSVCSSDIITAVGWNSNVTLCDYTAGTFTAGSTFTIRVTLRVNTASNNARISDINLPYKARF